MKMYLATAFSVLLVHSLGAVPVHAGGARFGSAATGLSGGLILGGSYGEAEERLGDSSFSGARVKPDDDAWKAYIGSRFNGGGSLILSFKTGFADFGKSEIRGNSERTESEAETWFANFTIDAPITNALTVFGKGGWHRWTKNIRQEQENSIGGPLNDVGTTRESHTFRDNDPFWGFGLRYQFVPQIAGKVEFERYRFSHDRNDIRDHRLISGGIEFIF